MSVLVYEKTEIDCAGSPPTRGDFSRAHMIESGLIVGGRDSVKGRHKNTGSARFQYCRWTRMKVPRERVGQFFVRAFAADAILEAAEAGSLW